MNTNLIVRCFLAGLLTTSAACLGDDLSSDEPSAPQKPGRTDASVLPPPSAEDEGSEEPSDDCWAEPPPQAFDAGKPGAPDSGKPGARDGGKPGAPDSGKPGAPDSGKPHVPRDGGVPPDAAAPSPLACSGRGIGSPTECLSYEEAEQRLAEECARDGLELTDVTQKGDVDCKPGTSHQAWGTCCPALTQANQDCWFESIQNKVCTPPERLQERAEESCASQGAYVPWLEAEDDECAGPAFKGAVYQCCPDPGVPYPL